MRSSGYTLFTCLAVLVLAPALALANGLYIPSVGARASAMGGAFIGLADDYSAIYYNPAGIVQINGFEMTVTGQDVISMASRDGFVLFEGLEGAEDNHNFALGEFSATSEGASRIAPGFFAYSDAGPLRGVIDKIGVAAYTLTEYGSKWGGDTVFSQSDFVGNGYPFDYAFLAGDMHDYESHIRTYVVSPVLATEIMPGLSIGVTANIAYSHFTLEDVFLAESVFEVDTPEAEDDWYLAVTPLQLTDDATGWGYGATIGVLYRANSQISAGVTVRTPMTVVYEGTHEIMASYEAEGIVESYKHTSEFEIEYPMWAGAGFAYRDFLFDGLTMTGDVQWTGWSSIQSIDRAIVWSAIFEGEDMSGFETTELKWEDTIEFAVGFDYRLGRSTSAHLGYRNSPTPATDDATYDFLLPQIDKQIVALGVTYRSDVWRASLGLEYHAGDERNLRNTYDMDGKHLEDVLVPTLSFTYAF